MSKNLFYRNAINLKMEFRFVLAFLAILATASGSALFSSLIQDDQKPIRHEVTVGLKLIQVYVVDKKGKPVPDLTKEDFEIYDEGEKVTITDFEKHLLEGAPETPPSTPAEKAKFSDPKMPCKYFLFFDFAFNTVNGVKDSRKAACHFIDTNLEPADQVAVLSYSSMKSLKIHEYLTTDHGKAREVVEGIGGKGILGRAEYIDQLMGTLAKISNGEPGAGQEIRKETSQDARALIKDEISLLGAERRDSKIQISFFMDSLTDLAKSLAYIPGKKNIIFFSSGIPESIFTGNYTVTEKKAGDAITTDMEAHDELLAKKYERMIKDLAASNCSVYAVLAAGGKADSLDSHSAEKAAPLSESPSFLGITSLQKLANETGGRYYGNVLNYERIMDDVQKNTASYYVLGYTVGENPDGKYHKLQVKVKREDCEVRSQAGYFNSRPFASFSKRDKEIQLLDLALNENPRTPLIGFFPLEIIPYSFKNDAGFVMLTQIPPDCMKKISGKDVEITELILNGEGDIVRGNHGFFDLTRFPEKTFSYYGYGENRPGHYTYRIILRNLETGQALRADKVFAIPQNDEAGLTLEPPLLLTPGEKTVYALGLIHEAKEFSSKKIDRIFPLLDNSMTPLLDPNPEIRDRRLIAGIRCRTIRNDVRNMLLSTRLTDCGTNESAPLPCRLTRRIQGGQCLDFFLEADLTGRQSGNYRLDFAVKDKTSGEEAAVFTFFRIP